MMLHIHQYCIFISKILHFNEETFISKHIQMLKALIDSSVFLLQVFFSTTFLSTLRPATVGACLSAAMTEEFRYGVMKDG